MERVDKKMINQEQWTEKRVGHFQKTFTLIEFKICIFQHFSLHTWYLRIFWCTVVENEKEFKKSLSFLFSAYFYGIASFVLCYLFVLSSCLFSSIFLKSFPALLSLPSVLTLTRQEKFVNLFCTHQEWWNVLSDVWGFFQAVEKNQSVRWKYLVQVSPAQWTLPPP